MTWKASEGIKAYLDGKLVKLLNDATTGGDYTHLRRRDGTTSTVGGRDGTPIASQLAGIVAQTARWQNTDSSACKTASQIRTEMFQKASDLSSTTGLYLWFQFDEGTGTTAEDLSPNGTDFTVGTLAKSAEAAWVGAGTFTRSTSTLKMTGAGTSLNYLSGEELGHLLIDNSSGTVTASVLTGTNNLTVSSLKVNDSSASFTAPSGTLTIDNEACGYAIYIDGVYIHSSGTVTLATGTSTNLDLLPSSGTGLNNLTITDGINYPQTATTLAGNLTINGGTFNTDSDTALTVLSLIHI